jgi:hypothetical protein
MTATVMTLSPHVPLSEYERMMRATVGRGDDAAIGVATTDKRRVRELGRLRGRLAADPALDCFTRNRPNGSTVLTAIRAGDQPSGYWGEVEPMASADDPLDVDVVYLDDLG